VHDAESGAIEYGLAIGLERSKVVERRVVFSVGQEIADSVFAAGVAGVGAGRDNGEPVRARLQHDRLGLLRNVLHKVGSFATAVIASGNVRRGGSALRDESASASVLGQALTNFVVRSGRVDNRGKTDVVEAVGEQSRHGPSLAGRNVNRGEGTAAVRSSANHQV